MDQLSEAISKGFREGLIGGFWMVFKWMWPLFIFLIFLKIFERWINKKIDDWKRRRRFRK